MRVASAFGGPPETTYQQQIVGQLARTPLFKGKGLSKERDRFLISYYLLLRYGDSVNISRGNIFKHGDQNYYRNVAEKTAAESFVPVKPAALAILEAHNFDLSGGANQDANR